MARKPKEQDRTYMDASAPAAQDDAKNFLAEKADDDREDAKAKHANKGLRTAKDLLGTMVKAVAHGLSSDSDDVKRACLDEVAELGNAVRDAARAAMRASKTETRNVQA